MYPLSTDDPYGEKRLERVQTPTGIKRVFNQVAREWGLGALIDAQDSEQSRTLEPREIGRNAYRHPIGRERCPRDERSRRRPGWVTCRFVLPGRVAVGLSLLARTMAEREHAERRNAPRGQRRRYPRTKNFYVLKSCVKTAWRCKPPTATSTWPAVQIPKFVKRLRVLRPNILHTAWKKEKRRKLAN